MANGQAAVNNMNFGESAGSPSHSPSTCVGDGASNNAPKFGTLVPNRIFVGGIPASTNEEELRQFFLKFGSIKDVKIIADRAGVSKGYGFVTFDSQTVAQKVLQLEADKLMFKDRKLNVGHAIRKQQLSRPDMLQTLGSVLLAGNAISPLALGDQSATNALLASVGMLPHAQSAQPASVDAISLQLLQTGLQQNGGMGGNQLNQLAGQPQLLFCPPTSMSAPSQAQSAALLASQCQFDPSALLSSQLAAMGQSGGLPVQYASNAALAAQLGLPPNWLLSIAAAKQQAALPFLQQAAAAQLRTVQGVPSNGSEQKLNAASAYYHPAANAAYSQPASGNYQQSALLYGAAPTAGADKQQTAAGAYVQVAASGTAPSDLQPSSKRRRCDVEMNANVGSLIAAPASGGVAASAPALYYGNMLQNAAAFALASGSAPQNAAVKSLAGYSAVSR